METVAGCLRRLVFVANPASLMTKGGDAELKKLLYFSLCSKERRPGTPPSAAKHFATDGPTLFLGEKDRREKG